MIKVAINIPSATSGHIGRGIGFYTSNLIPALEKIEGLKLRKFSSLTEINDKVDMIHYPFFDLFFTSLPLKKRLPRIVTVHDVIPLLFPTRYPPGIKGSLAHLLQKIALKNTDAIITNSETSKKDIIQKLGVPEAKVFVTYLGVGEDYRVIKDKEILTKISKKYSLPKEFALFVGNVNWNKNILGIAEATIHAGIPLVMAGKSLLETHNLNHPELTPFKKFLEIYGNHPLIHRLGFVEQEDIVGIYNLASAVLLPSFYEGFGLPILEAQASGVPVITSNISSMPEIAGDGAILVNPSNTKTISEALQVILKDKEAVRELVKRGFENVKKFSWSKCAFETYSVYQKVYTIH